MKKLILIIFILTTLGFAKNSFAQKDTCLVGMYILSLTDFKIDDQSFKADFWLWFVYDNDSLKLQDAIEITNAKTVEFSNFATEKRGGRNWAQVKCKAVINENWDVTNFPFDKQTLQIALEHSLSDATTLVFKADKENSKLDSTFNFDEWRIDSLHLVSENKTYNTTFGDPILKGSSVYPGVTFHIHITRTQSAGILVKMLTGVYVAFSIALLGFLIKPSLADRLGLCVGGIFAAVGNKYIIESIVPSSTANTLLDNIHNLTFVSILIMIAVTVISLKWTDTENELLRNRAKKLDVISFGALLLIFIVTNFILIVRA